jgi:hypothetical protein
MFTRRCANDRSLSTHISAISHWTGRGALLSYLRHRGYMSCGVTNPIPTHPGSGYALSHTCICVYVILANAPSSRPADYMRVFVNCMRGTSVDCAHKLDDKRTRTPGLSHVRTMHLKGIQIKMLICSRKGGGVGNFVAQLCLLTMCP